MTDQNKKMKGRGNKSNKINDELGYSLLEILVVLAIISTLAVLVGPRLLGQVDKSKVVSTTAQAKQLVQSLKLYRMEYGRYPTKQEGLRALVNSDVLDSNEVPRDAWGNEFVYEPPEGDESFSARPKLYSLGADNEPGGEGLNKDIYG